MVRLGTLLIRRLVPAAICATAIVACGASSPQKPATTASTPAAGTATSKTSKTASLTEVKIYSSLPESGSDAAQSRQIETGIQFALKQAHHRAGQRFQISYKPLCDSSPSRHRSSSRTPTSRSKIATVRTAVHCTGSWNQTVVANNAEKAASDPRTVAYIGDLNSGATAVSLPILNQAGIVQITPGSGYPGLTNSVTVKSPKGLPVTQPGEPDKYYPAGIDHRTLLRLIPNDLVQASSALYVLHKQGCQKFSAWDFGTDSESTALLNAVIATASRYKMVWVKPPALTKDYVTYADALRPAEIRCVVLVGHETRAAEMLTLELREQLSPAPTIMGTSGFCNRQWLQGIPGPFRKNVSAVLYCTTPALPVSRYSDSAKFMTQFRATYHRRPTAYDLYGYVATVMIVRALEDSERGGDTRGQVLSGMVEDFAPDEVDTMPGQVSAFSFDTSGNVGSNSYGIDDFRGGVLRYAETVDVDKPRYLLPSAG